MALALLLQAATGDAVGIDQVASPKSSQAPRRLPEGPDKPAQAATITQLPTDLEPVAEAKEEALAEPPAPVSAASRASAEVARAIGVIQNRGQQVTPELLAREVGPDVLELYLAQPGGLPAPTGVPGAPAPAAPVPGVTIIPSGGVPK